MKHLLSASDPLLLEAFADRLLHSSREQWRSLFCGEGTQNVRVERPRLALLSVLPGQTDVHDIIEDLPDIAPLYSGMADTAPPQSALIAFDAAAQGMEFALELHRCAPHARLRIAMHVGFCDVVRFTCGCSDGRIHLGTSVDTVLGMAVRAPAGTIQLSPEAFADLGEAADGHGRCLVASEYEGEDLTGVSFIPTPAAALGLSTFAGLGRF